MIGSISGISSLINSAGSTSSAASAISSLNSAAGSVSGTNSATQINTSSTVAAGGNGLPFSDIFNNLIDNVKQTDRTVKQDQVLLATGQTDDLHTITINAAKADLALQMLVQVRNKALDAYNDIMKMSI